MPVVIVGIAIALAAAARSTWSPCGLSMLSQITPVAEAGRGHKFTRTAGWFILGATLGGLTLGSAMACGAAAVSALGISRDAAIAAIAGCAFAAAAIDAHLFGFGPPFVRRQVNDAWLSKYRAWVYGGGFGWQIGAGVVTYVMTAAVPLLVVIGALSATPIAAVSIATVFGLTRGIAVLLGARLHTSEELFAFHRRFDASTDRVRAAVIVVQMAVGIACAWIVAPRAIAAGLTLIAIAVIAAARDRATPPSEDPSRRTLPTVARGRAA